MAEYPQRRGNPWSERKRLIRFRRKRERNLRFWQEFKVVPRWLIGIAVVLCLIAVAIAVTVNLNPALNDGEMFPPELQGPPGGAIFRAGRDCDGGVAVSRVLHFPGWHTSTAMRNAAE